MNEYGGRVEFVTDYAPFGTIKDIRVTHADPKITVSAELMADHDEKWMQVTDTEVRFCGLVYRIMGKDNHGDTLAWARP